MPPPGRCGDWAIAYGSRLHLHRRNRCRNRVAPIRDRGLSHLFGSKTPTPSPRLSESKMMLALERAK